jgi:hypothetical protein
VQLSEEKIAVPLRHTVHERLVHQLAGRGVIAQRDVTSGGRNGEARNLRPALVASQQQLKRCRDIAELQMALGQIEVACVFRQDGRLVAVDVFSFDETFIKQVCLQALTFLRA